MKEFTRAIDARLVPRGPWFGRIAFAAASAVLVAAVFLLRPEPAAPFPLEPDDPGIEEVWSPDRAARLASIAGAGSLAMRAAWPRIREAIDGYAAAWQSTRATVRSARHAWPTALTERAALCLVDASVSLNTVLTAVDASIDRRPEDGPPATSLVDGWFAALRPPTLCKNAGYLTSLAAAPGMLDASPGQQAWPRAYAQGYWNFLAGDLDQGESGLRRALIVADDDPARQAWSRFGLMSIESRRGQSAAAVAQLHAILALTERSGDAYLRVLALTWLVREANAAGEPGSALALYAMAIGRLRSLVGEDDPLVREKASYLHGQAAWAVGELALRRTWVRCPVECADCQATPRASQAYALACVKDLLALAGTAASSHEARSEVSVIRAEIAWKLGRFEPALALAREAERFEAAAFATTSRTARISHVLAGAQHELEQRREPAERGPSATITASEISYRKLLEDLTALGERDTPEVAQICRRLAAQTETRGDYQAALEFAERAREIVERPPTTDPLAALELHDILGSLYLHARATRDDELGVALLRRRGLELTQDPTLMGIPIRVGPGPYEPVELRVAHPAARPTPFTDRVSRPTVINGPKPPPGPGHHDYLNAREGGLIREGLIPVLGSAELDLIRRMLLDSVGDLQTSDMPVHDVARALATHLVEKLAGNPRLDADLGRDG